MYGTYLINAALHLYNTMTGVFSYFKVDKPGSLDS